MFNMNDLNKAGLLPTIIVLGGLSYVGILLLVLVYSFIECLKSFFLK